MTNSSLGRLCFAGEKGPAFQVRDSCSDGHAVDVDGFPAKFVFLAVRRLKAPNQSRVCRSVSAFPSQRP